MSDLEYDIYGKNKRKTASNTVVPPEEFDTTEKHSGTTLRFELCGDRILFEDFKLKDKIGSIIMPQSTCNDLAKARIVAVGPDVKNKKLKIGTIVIIVPDLGTKMKDNGKEYRTLPENSVMAIDHEFDFEKECEVK